MCGIDVVLTDEKKYDIVPNIKNRGPDEIVKVKCHKCLVVFYRLAIVGNAAGRQPFITDRKNITVCNGEIYNHQMIMRELRAEFSRRQSFLPVVNAENSDCYCIHALCNAAFIDKRSIPFYLRGEFAFVHYDQQNMYFARDCLGKKALYFGVKNGKLTRISSAIEAFDKGDSVLHVRPGCLYIYNVESSELKVKRYIKTFEDRFVEAMAGPSIPAEIKYAGLEEIPKDENQIRTHLFNVLKESVQLRITQKDPTCNIGFMLSGGFDSSLVLSLALACGIQQPVQAYTFGFEKNADDIKSAGIMVDWIKDRYGPNSINWHVICQPVEKGLQTLEKVIGATETYDTTTIRASTPLYLLSEAMAKDGIRVILSGEGADELFGGYLYFKYAPNHKEFIKEIGFLLDHLFEADCLRADRATAAWSTEVRFPFLDEVFVDAVIRYNIIINEPENTKMTLRKIVPSGYLPAAIHWGKKEAFSDAVGHSWKDSIGAFAQKQLGNYKAELAQLNSVQNEKTKARTPEEEYYQAVFIGKFGDRRSILSRYWMPKWINTNDPSARVLDVYNDPKQKAFTDIAVNGLY